LDWTEPVVRPVKDQTRVSAGPVHLKEPISNQTDVKPVNWWFLPRNQYDTRHWTVKKRVSTAVHWISNVEQGGEERNKGKLCKKGS
jgi:hypothetical protein